MTRDDRGRVLLVQQRGGAFKGEWLLPGGGLEEGESPEEAVRREVREETGLEATGLRVVSRYDVQPLGFPRMELWMYAGSVAGMPRVGVDGEPVAWSSVDAATAHPVLLRELRDAGVIALQLEEIEARCRRRGIEMLRAG